MTRRRACLLLLAVWLPILGQVASRAWALRNLKEGDPAPSFRLQNVSGKEDSLEARRGRPVVLLYWRPGQLFSEQAAAALAELHGRFASAGVDFLSLVHVDEQSPDVKGAAAKLPFPVLLDPAREVYGSYGLFVLPTIVVLDKEHRVKACLASFRRETAGEVDDLLSSLLGRKARAKAAAPAAPARTEPPGLVLGRKLVEDRRYEEALPLLKEAVSDADPAFSSEARLLTGRALLETGRAEQSRVELEACIKSPSCPRQAKTFLGKALLDLGKADAAETVLKEASMLNPEASLPRYYLGQLYEKSGRKDEALALYRKALDRLLSR